MSFNDAGHGRWPGEISGHREEPRDKLAKCVSQFDQLTTRSTCIKITINNETTSPVNLSTTVLTASNTGLLTDHPVKDTLLLQSWQSHNIYQSNAKTPHIGLDIVPGIILIRLYPFWLQRNTTAVYKHKTNILYKRGYRNDST